MKPEARLWKRWRKGDVLLFSPSTLPCGIRRHNTHCHPPVYSQACTYIPSSDLQGHVWPVYYRRISSQMHQLWMMTCAACYSGDLSWIQVKWNWVYYSFPCSFASGSGPSHFFLSVSVFGVLKAIYSTGGRLWELIKTLQCISEYWLEDAKAVKNTLAVISLWEQRRQVNRSVRISKHLCLDWTKHVLCLLQATVFIIGQHNLPKRKVKEALGKLLNSSATRLLFVVLEPKLLCILEQEKWGFFTVPFFKSMI